MVRMGHERVLLVGDTDRRVYNALRQADPAAEVVLVQDYFEAVAELHSHAYSAVLAAAEPIERRPEAAVRTLRQMAGRSRLVLFGDASLEPVSRKMLDFGCDDYIVSPVSPGELTKIFANPSLRLSVPEPENGNEPILTAPPSVLSLMTGLPLASILLESLETHPHDAAAEAVRRLNAHMAPPCQLQYRPGTAPASVAVEGLASYSHPVRADDKPVATLTLLLPRDEDQADARHFLAQLAQLLTRQLAIQERHNRMQKLAITDELTGLYNARYFKHFLNKIIERARVKRFAVTLLMFDIDNFKRYNDLFGHAMGDEILRQTGLLMKRCCREHDLVARLGGDEFAVVFWEKEGPRQPRDAQPQPATTSARALQTPMQVFERFKRLLATHAFEHLGSDGQGTLTASAGMAVFPFDVPDAESLIRAADQSLMFGAKKSGKNTIFLVGDNNHRPAPPPPG